MKRRSFLKGLLALSTVTTVVTLPEAAPEKSIAQMIADVGQVLDEANVPENQRLAYDPGSGDVTAVGIWKDKKLEEWYTQGFVDV